MYKLDINKGDTILTGKYRNKKETVKTFGHDELGQPTINGKTILKFRIEKLMPKKEDKKMNENYTHYPSLKKLVQVNYTDPRVEEGKYKIHCEIDGICVADGKAYEGTYVMYEDEAYPGNYIAVHVSSEVNEETDEPNITVVAMDKNRKLVRDRLAYRRRKSAACVNEALNEEGRYDE